MQRRKGRSGGWSDWLNGRRLDCHRIDIVNNDAGYVGILDLDGRKRGMYLESVLLDSSNDTNMFILRKPEQNELDGFQ